GRGTWSAAGRPATASSLAARNARPTRLRRRFARARNTISAQRHEIHASQRSSGKLSPSEAGGVGGATLSPFSPPNACGYLSARPGRPIANASVAPARYGPLRREAAAPTATPTSAVIAAADTSAAP